MTVLVITYEAEGDAAETMREHYKRRDATQRAGFAVAEKYGARGFRPGRDGKPRSLIFNQSEVPQGFRYHARLEPGVTEVLPHKGTKIGKAAAADMAAIKRAPDDLGLASELGWSPPEYPTDGATIYFPTTIAVIHPAPRYFLRVPEVKRYRWTRRNLREVPQSELLQAVERHNAEARRLRESVTFADEAAA